MKAQSSPKLSARTPVRMGPTNTPNDTPVITTPVAAACSLGDDAPRDLEKTKGIYMPLPIEPTHCTTAKSNRL
jgi:hypothetical protein